MSKNKARIVDEKPTLNKKLGNVKFEQIFDGTSLSKAEQAFDRKKGDFIESVKEEINQLKDTFTAIDSEPSEEDFKIITDLALQIKSKGATAGLPLITSVARSLYEYCDRLGKTASPAQFKIVKIHYNALNQILVKNFDSDNEEKVNKLLAGLKELTK